MKYINTESFQVHSEQEIRNIFPNTSFGDPFIAPKVYSLVFSTPKPSFNEVTQSAQESTPILTSKGHWEESWIIVELFQTQEEREAAITNDIEAKRKAQVPQVVTMRQARLALLGAGLLPSVTAAINSLPSPQKEAASIEWEYSQTVERNRGFVLTLGAALGLTDLQLDNLFALAGTL